MIVGNGLLAKAFRSKFENVQAVTIFASGVSNSSEIREAEFRRERTLLQDTIDRNKGSIVYFSTCSVSDADRQSTPYVKHKMAAERLIGTQTGGIVFRLPQVVGRTDNPYTLTNFLARKILRNEPFTIWDKAIRTLIDVDDVALIGTALIERGSIGKTIDLCPPFSLTMLELVKIMELVLARPGRYKMVARGGGSHSDASRTSQIAAELGIDFSHDYVERVLRKYYGEHY